MPNSRCAYSRPLIAALSFATAPFASTAHSKQMSNDAIREAVTGATVHLDAPLGTTIPLEFSDNGTVTGTAGRLAFYLGAATDTGRWWTANNRLCYRWTYWFKGEPSCMKIARQGAAFAWESDEGRTGTARIVQRRALAVVQPTVPAPIAASAAATQPSAATQPRIDTPKVATARPASAGPQRFAVAGVGQSGTSPTRAIVAGQTVPAPQRPSPAPAAKPHPTASSPSKPTVGPALPPSAALGGPVVAKPPAPPWETKIEPRSAAPPARVASLPPPKSPTASQPNPTAQNAQQSVTDGPGWRVVNVDAFDVLNVRAEPFPDAGVVGAIPPGGRGVQPLGACHGTWCRVRWQTHDGWVHSGYVAPDGTR